MTLTHKLLVALMSLAATLGIIAARPVEYPAIQGATTGFVPLIDMGSQTYLGFSGGLYPNATNTMPSDHHQIGLNQGRAIRPLDTQGNPSANGKYVLLSIGMSHATQEFCSQSGALPCDSWTFMGQAAADNAVNKTQLVIANGAQGTKTASYWDSPNDPDYDRVRDTVLVPQGLSEKQVQAIWLKAANASPTVSLPSSSADAYTLEKNLGNIVRSLKVRYPNVKQVFISSRSYGGYAETRLNPEPYAYESGFSVKWLIEAQIRQARNGTIDPQSGNLNYTTVAPWVAWGPYPWADGTNARSDGLTWQASDFQSDGTHPALPGERKVGQMLLNFFKTSSLTTCWFVTGGTCA
jgi:hypothetical protein